MATAKKFDESIPELIMAQNLIKELEEDKKREAKKKKTEKPKKISIEPVDIDRMIADWQDEYNKTKQNTETLSSMLPPLVDSEETKFKQTIDSKISKYRAYIEKYLTKEFGEIPLAYEFQLDLFFDNLIQYYHIKAIVADTGIYDSETGRKNPLLSTQKDLQALILKQGQMFGLNFWSKSKIKMGETDDTEDFIGGLLK